MRSHAIRDLRTRLPLEDAIAMLDAQPLPHHFPAIAPPMNSVFELAIHLFLAMPLSWIYLPSLVRRKEEHLHIGGSTRTCHCRPAATEYDVVRSGLVDLQDAADARALLASSLSASHGLRSRHR